MGSRMLLRRSAAVLRNRDGGLLSILRSELEYELSSNPPQSAQICNDGKMGSFSVDWDDENTRDLVLRRRFGSGEEIALSAILGPLISEDDDPTPRHFLMKICIKKPDPDPILQFDCTVFRQDDDVDSEFIIDDVKYLDSSGFSKKSRYRGPDFSCLDPNLQDAFKDYLMNRGINAELTNFILLRLCQKEQSQYVSWLQRIENFIKRYVVAVTIKQ